VHNVLELGMTCHVRTAYALRELSWRVYKIAILENPESRQSPKPVTPSS